MRITVPGRVNLIGEHIDYHQLAVLPMAIQRRVTLDFQPSNDDSVTANSPGYPDREFNLNDLEPFPSGDWGNYLKAAVRVAQQRWSIRQGIEATVHSDLPPAAGLSSSSALLTAFTLALLHANGVNPRVDELMEVLPDGEQFVGTRGGGMDHAAILASRSGCALLVHFAPFRHEPIPIPDSWAFLIAHSLTHAEKSGPVREEYNARREAGSQAFQKAGAGLTEAERAAYLHVRSESQRVEDAVKALRNYQFEEFGRLLSASHASLRDQLQVSNPALDELVACAEQSGALGARLTGAGFGGCVIALSRRENVAQLRSGLVNHFYRSRPDFIESEHLIDAIPSAGAIPF